MGLDSVPARRGQAVSLGIESETSSPESEQLCTKIEGNRQEKDLKDAEVLYYLILKTARTPTYVNVTIKLRNSSARIQEESIQFPLQVLRLKFIISYRSTPHCTISQTHTRKTRMH